MAQNCGDTTGEANSTPTHCPRVLLIEDDSEFLELLVRRFTRRGVAVVACQSTDEALSAVGDHPSIALAIIDGLLQGEAGTRVMERLRQQAPDLKFIMLSGRADQSAIDDALSQGVSEYLCKPCSLSNLESAMERVLNAPLSR